MQRKFKFLAIIAISIMAISVVFASDPALPSAIATWTGNSVVNLTSSTASDTFTTTVVGVATNAVDSALTINGEPYTSAGQAGVSYPITNFVEGPNSGDPNNPSTVTISASGFVPSDYAVFQVTIKNTGSATLGFTNYQQLDEFVNSGGTSISYLFPPTDPYNAGYTAPASPAPITGTWTITPVSGTGWDAVATSVPTTSGTLPVAPLADQTVANMNTQFEAYLSNNAVEGCASTWCQNNIYLGTTLPTTLAPGATFVYYIYTGLGDQTVYGIPASLFVVTIPLTAIP
jgi:hypothetical protein